MRNNDLTPFLRSTVGFDRLISALDQAARPEWPHHNVLRTGPDAYRIDVAVAGYAPADIDVTQDGTTLLVAGRRAAGEAKAEYLHQGITRRPFRLSLSLAEHVRVESADLVDGMLSVSLVRVVPEALRPRTIAIGATRAATAQDNAPATDAKAAA